MCNCESIAAIMLRYKLWPSTPCEPRVAFCVDFMESLRAFMMESQVSVTGFCHVYQVNDRSWGDVVMWVSLHITKNIILGEPYQYSLRW